jgi:hypothetical protein
MSKEKRFRKLTCGALMAVVPVLGILIGQADAQNPAAKSPAPPVKQAPSTEPTKEEFRKLPPNALLTVGGRQITKQALLDQIRKNLTTNQTAANNQLAAKLSASRAKFFAQQQAKLQAANDKVFAEAARLTKLQNDLTTSPGFQAIQNESQNLLSQYKNAPPAEKTRMQARARELHKQLQQLQAAATGGPIQK